MSYLVYPQGLVNHSVLMEARSTDYPNYPYMPADHTIKWRLNGVTVKNGNTSNINDLRINTKNSIDYNLYAKDSGLLLDFIIDGSLSSSAIVIENTLPIISSYGIESDQYGICPKSPKIYWQFDDEDNDRQYVCRVLVGLSPGSSEIYDSGKIYGDPGDVNGDGIVDQKDLDQIDGLLGEIYGSTRYLLKADFNRDGIIDNLDKNIVKMFMGSEYPLTTNSIGYSFNIPTMPSGLLFHWTLKVGDGEKLSSSDPDWPDPVRKYVSVSGTGSINYTPLISSVFIDGM